jgi:hypothetical protein
MNVNKFWKEKFWKRASFTDYMLVKWSAISFGMMLACLIPSITEIPTIWYAAITIILGLKPMLTVLRK